MLCVQLGNIDLDLEKLDKIIRKCVPSGFDIHNERKTRFDDILNLKCYRELKDTKRFERSIGTLGGGNHFIEVDVDDENNKYLVIHTGSRNLGKQVADYYQELANQLINYGKQEFIDKKNTLIKEYKEQGRKTEIQDALKELNKEYLENKNKMPKDLCYLEGEHRENYLHDMKICQEFACLNRKTIALEIMKELGCALSFPGNNFETIHNYISFEDNIVRKGAISAKEGELLLIPMNMRDGCIIGVGKGNDDWNQSAPHGAGRIMSRMKAKEVLTMDDYRDSMKDIFTSSVNEDTLDEAPMAYKPMQEIIDCIGDTIEIEKVIKPIYNFKASE